MTDRDALLAVALTVACVAVGVGHLLWGHSATGIAFLLTSVVGVFVTLSLWSARGRT